MTEITLESFHTQRALAEMAGPLDAARTLNQHAEAIKLLARRAARDIIEIGYHLTKAHKSAGHGKWLRWLDQEFGWSEQTARNYMRVFEMASIHNAVVDLQLPLRSLYVLAAPSTPEPVRQAVIDRAARGEKISHVEVTAAVDAAAGIKPKFDKPKAQEKLPSYAPNDVIDQMVALSSRLGQDDINRAIELLFKLQPPKHQSFCMLKLRAIFRGA